MAGRRGLCFGRDARVLAFLASWVAPPAPAPGVGAPGWSLPGLGVKKLRAETRDNGGQRVSWCVLEAQGGEAAAHAPGDGALPNGAGGRLRRGLALGGRHRRPVEAAPGEFSMQNCTARKCAPLAQCIVLDRHPCETRRNSAPRAASHAGRSPHLHNEHLFGGRQRRWAHPPREL